MTLTFPFWLAILPLLVAGSLLLWAEYRRRRAKRWLPHAAIGAVVAIGLGPLLFFDRITIDDEGITQRTGFWFAPTHHTLRFAGVTQVRVELANVGTQRRNRQQQVWTVHRDDGTVDSFDPGDLWDFHRETMVAELRRRGIRVD